MGEGCLSEGAQVANDAAFPVVGLSVRDRDVAQDPFGDGVDEVVFVLDVAVQRHGPYPEALRQRRHGNGLEALGVEQPECGLDDAVTRQRVARRPPVSRGAHRRAWR